MIWMSDKVHGIGTVDPATITNTETFTDVIDMSKYNQVMFIFCAGDIHASDTVVARVVTCDSGGTNAAALKTATTLAAGAADNKQIIICVKGDDLPGTTNADRYIKGGVVSGATGGGPICVVALGMPKYSSTADLASIAEIVTDND